MFPVFFSGSVVCIHDSMFNGLPSKHDITFEVVSIFGWYSLQYPVCCLKVLRNDVKNDLLVLASLNDLEAKSAMLFFSPSMWTVRSGDALADCCLKANALSRCPALVDVDVLFLLVQFTAALLSQNIATDLCFSCVVMTVSRHNHASTMPAISKSFIVIVPFFLFAEISCC